MAQASRVCGRTLREVHPSGREWATRVAAWPGLSTMFQTHEMGEIKRQTGWRPRFFEVDDLPVVVHEKRAPGLGKVGRDYHIHTWRTFCESGAGQIFFATHEGQDVAAAFVVVTGEVANYREGASIRQRPVRGAAQLMQLEAMVWAQGQGATVYDMCGTPHSTKLDDPDDPLHGVGEFKRGFSKEVTDWVGAWDLPLRPRRYAVWERVGHRVAAKLTSRGASAATFY